MTRKALFGILTLTLCAMVLMKPETAETREPEVHSSAADYIQHGREHLEAGDYADAIADFDKAIQIAPDRPEAFYYRANAKFQLGKSQQEQGDIEQVKRTYHSALEDYTQVITLDPENPQVYVFGGMVHLRLANVADAAGALADFERVIAIKPDSALVYYAQGRAKQALGQPDAAAFDFAKARVLNPAVDKLYPFSSEEME